MLEARLVGYTKEELETQGMGDQEAWDISYWNNIYSAAERYQMWKDAAVKGKNGLKRIFLAKVVIDLFGETKMEVLDYWATKPVKGVIYNLQPNVKQELPKKAVVKKAGFTGLWTTQSIGGNATPVSIEELINSGPYNVAPPSSYVGGGGSVMVMDSAVHDPDWDAIAQELDEESE